MPILTLQLTVPIVVLIGFPDADQMESMDTVSLQAVTLADGSTAYIQHDSKASFADGQIMDGQVIQLEDGSAAYVQHVSMPKAGIYLHYYWYRQCFSVTLDVNIDMQEETACSLRTDKQSN